MPTVLTHAVVPVAIAVAAGAARIPPRLALLGVLAAMAPDLDVLAFRFGIPYEHSLGHRGASHSVVGAALIALLLFPWTLAMRRASWSALAFLWIAALSHGALDMLTNGGLGVEVWWPASTQRHFLPCRVIQVSPLGLHRVFGASGLAVLRSEVLWVWLPAFAAAFAWRAARRRREGRAAVARPAHGASMPGT